MAELRAIRNHIIFQFLNKKVKHMDVNQFEETTDWGLTFVRSDDSAGLPRWGVVTSVGPEVPEDIQVGMTVLIDALKWTDGFEFEREWYWRTDSDHILGIREDADAA